MNLPDYFAICASAETDEMGNPRQQKQRLIEEASRVLTLDFSMQRLQAKQVSEANLFNKQSEQLQLIE